MDSRSLMRNLLYIGHAFHTKTKSTRFLIDALATRYRVSELAITPSTEGDLLERIDLSNLDIVVLFQLDYLAPIFLSLGVPTIVVPMFDGSGEMPQEHWELSGDARFVCFSRRQYLRIRRAGCVAMHAQYYPEPVAERDLPDFSDLKLFFWERRPDHGMTIEKVDRLAQDQMRSMHFHLAPDVPWEPPAHRAVLSKPGVTTSVWGADRSVYADALAASNVFVAPRLAEGIGMSFLEAMAQGKLVIAFDSSTHNEYIANWVNGVLFNDGIDALPRLTKHAAAELGYAAWRSVQRGRERWPDVLSRILDFVDEAPKPSRKDIPADVLAREIPRAYGAGVPVYETYLRRVLPLFGSPLGRRKVAAEATTAPHAPTTIEFGDGNARKFLASGWSKDELDLVWTEATEAEIRFAAGSELQTRPYMAIRLKGSPALKQVHVSWILNARFIGAGAVRAEPSTAYLRVGEAIRAVNSLRVFADTQAPLSQTDPRLASIGVQEISFLEALPEGQHVLLDAAGGGAVAARHSAPAPFAFSWRAIARLARRLVLLARPGMRRRLELAREIGEARAQRQWKRCVEIYAEWLMIEPENGPIWVQYGHALKESGSLEAAEGAYGRAAQLLPRDADLQLQFGHLYKLMGRREQSLASYKKAHELDPSAKDPIRELEAYGVWLDKGALLSASVLAGGPANGA
jgi:tetratricopeptide (TPR) repeat protein/glycosyltransferase involved in cell wall biosynthesis